MNETLCMNNQELQEYYERKGKRNCDKGRHTMDWPILQHPIIGGILGWKCYCGLHTEGRRSKE